MRVRDAEDGRDGFRTSAQGWSHDITNVLKFSAVHELSRMIRECFPIIERTRGEEEHPVIGKETATINQSTGCKNRRTRALRGTCVV